MNNELLYADCTCGEPRPAVKLIEVSYGIVAQIMCMRCTRRIVLRIYSRNRDGTLNRTPNDPVDAWNKDLLDNPKPVRAPLPKDTP